MTVACSYVLEILMVSARIGLQTSQIHTERITISSSSPAWSTLDSGHASHGYDPKHVSKIPCPPGLSMSMCMPVFKRTSSHVMIQGILIHAFGTGPQLSSISYISRRVSFAILTALMRYYFMFQERG